MFARITTVFTFLFFILPALAAATAVARTNPTPIPASQCNTGPVQCCNSVQSASNPLVGILAGVIGAVLGPLDVLVGLTCNPISVIGIGGNSCSAQPVCCTNNSFNGIIAIGCTPVNLNL